MRVEELRSLADLMEYMYSMRQKRVANLRSDPVEGFTFRNRCASAP